MNGDGVQFEGDLVDYSPGVDDSTSGMLMSTLQRKRSFSDILRGVKVHEEMLQCIVARLGGGIQGLEALMEHVNHWAMVSEDADVVTATITRGIVDLGMPPMPKRHCNLGISSTNCEDNACGPCFNVPRVDAIEATVNHGAAHTRALRKAHMVRQRGKTRVQRHHSMSKCGNQWRQWRPSTSPQLSQDAEPKLSTQSAKEYEFLFQKELRASDVSSLGRIVLPKKDAENHLPILIVREGIMISFEDYHSEKFWTARYRFWPNNKSRMYVLENIGAFVNYHHLQEGDLLLCYRNEHGGYVIRGQKVRTKVQTPPECLNLKGVQPREITTTEIKTVTTVLPSMYQQFVEGESTSGTLSNSCSDSLNYTIGEIGDGNHFQDGYNHYQSCVSRQSGYPLNCEDGLRTSFSASYRPLVPDWGSDSAVGMVTVTNLKQRYMDENLFLE